MMKQFNSLGTEKTIPDDSDIIPIQQADGITRHITRENFLTGINGNGGLTYIQLLDRKVPNANGYAFSKAGECPVKYEVSCGNECPEGSHKCTHKKYPGYCCVPCKEVGDKLKNIANKVGR